jgi:glycolate oxidase iron-sulfur subunit
MHLLTVCADQPTALLTDLFSRCLLCGACEQVCARQLPITQLVVQARSRFPLLLGPGRFKKAAACVALSSPALLEGLVKTGISLRRILSLPAESGLRLKLALLEERPVFGPPSLAGEAAAEQADCGYFTGCFARHLQPSIAAATINLLQRCGLRAHVPEKQGCCGLAAWSSGNLEQARDLAKRNMQAFAETAGPVITSCASCSAHLLAYPDLFDENDPWRERAQDFAARVCEFTVFFNEHLPKKDRSDALRIFYHDPCHLRFQPDGMSAPRKLLTKMGCTVLEPEDGPHCCGQGGLFHIACPDTAEKIFTQTSRQALRGHPDCITSTCSGCLMQYQQGLAALGETVKVVHLAALLTENATAS